MYAGGTETMLPVSGLLHNQASALSFVTSGDSNLPPSQKFPFACFQSLVFQAKLRQKRRKETRLELERVRALDEKAEVA